MRSAGMSYALTIIPRPWAFPHVRNNIPALRLGMAHSLILSWRFCSEPGNIWEWNETVFDSCCGQRGGSFISLDRQLHAEASIRGDPADKSMMSGFRVAQVPGPDCTFDGDGDGDIDLIDFGMFQVAFTGSE